MLQIRVAQFMPEWQTELLKIFQKVAHFRPELVAHFPPESVAQFAPESVAQFRPV